jgi:hypothetical protein
MRQSQFWTPDHPRLSDDLSTSAPLIEKHVRERRGKEAATLDAAGVVLGSFGLVAFGLVIWLTIARCPVWDTFSLRFRDSPSRRSDGSHGDGVVTPARDL